MMIFFLTHHTSRRLPSVDSRYAPVSSLPSVDTRMSLCSMNEKETFLFNAFLGEINFVKGTNTNQKKTWMRIQNLNMNDEDRARVCIEVMKKVYDTTPVQIWFDGDDGFEIVFHT